MATDGTIQSLSDIRTRDNFGVLKLVSFNMHGFHQGFSVVDELVNTTSPDVFFIQEHWLTPANLYLFDKHFVNYFSFGVSAMTKHVESGMQVGRPFGGVIMLISNKLRGITQTVHCDERFVVVKIADKLLVNVYLPCQGTPDRVVMCEDLLAQISSWCERYSGCELVIAGDFNCDLSSGDTISRYLNEFMAQFLLQRCDVLFSCVNPVTYVNTALNHESCIDYVLVSSGQSVCDFSIVEPDVNFSDHLPLLATVAVSGTVTNDGGRHEQVNVQYARWDKADTCAYYKETGSNLSPLLLDLDRLNSGGTDENSVHNGIDKLYECIVRILTNAENQFVPKRSKNFYKFWWNEELNVLKQAAIESNQAWKAAGKPRSGPIFSRRQHCRLLYRKQIKECQKQPSISYSNDLHDALLRKNSAGFWKCWRSKFEISNKCVEVDQCVEPDVIANKFANHFCASYKANNAQNAEMLYKQYTEMRNNYCGLPITDEQLIDTELVSNVIARLHRGKAADAAGLTAEHLIYSHPLISVVLSKLFRLIMLSRHVPAGFRYSYIVPVPKLKDCRTKSVTCDDFRGVAISPVISKVFEHCILDKFGTLFSSCDAQFGFKKGSGCRNAIYSVRKIVDEITKTGNTVNICSIDLSKAFDKVNHFGMYIKLMKRLVPTALLELLENWMSGCFAYVKWNNSCSLVFSVCSGVRQGAVLSPLLFAVYIDEIGKLCDPRNSCFVILYADDIILITISVTMLQNLLFACEKELTYLDMLINSKKSCCVRIGPRYDNFCVNIATCDGRSLAWVKEIRYLGIYIVSSRTFRCSLDYAKRSFYRAANGIFGKIGRIASEDVVIQLLKSKCIPILLYALEVCNLPKRDLQALDFSVNRFFMKLFRTSDMSVVNYCQLMFCVELPSVVIKRRMEKFEGIL